MNLKKFFNILSKSQRHKMREDASEIFEVFYHQFYKPYFDYWFDRVSDYNNTCRNCRSKKVVEKIVGYGTWDKVKQVVRHCSDCHYDFEPMKEVFGKTTTNFIGEGVVSIMNGSDDVKSKLLKNVYAETLFAECGMRDTYTLRQLRTKFKSIHDHVR